MIIVQEMNLEWEHLLRTFLRLFRRKNDLSGLQKQTKLKSLKSQYSLLAVRCDGNFRHITQSQ